MKLNITVKSLGGKERIMDGEEFVSEFKEDGTTLLESTMAGIEVAKWWAENLHEFGVMTWHFTERESWTTRLERKGFRQIDCTDGINSKSGHLFGNDECFSGELFYQWLLSADHKLFRCFYRVGEGSDLENTDWNNPSRIDEWDEDADIIEGIVSKYC